MSAFIMNLDRIASLAAFIDTLNYVGFEYIGFSIPESLHNALEPEKRCDNERDFFNKLYAFNVAAVNGRYNSDESTSANMPKDYKIMHHPSEWNREEQHHIIKQWHYDIYKLLQCFIYQCTEDATYNTPLYKGLTDLENKLAHFIVENSMNYNIAMWG